MHISRLRPHIDFWVKRGINIHRVVVKKRSHTWASNSTATESRDPKDFAFLVPREPLRILSVAIVDADVVAVATIDVVAQNLCEASLVVEAQVVLDDDILVSVVDVGTVGILRPVCIHQPVVLNEYALAFE